MLEREQATLSHASLPSPWLLISDLDGTILDHWNYSAQAMLPVLEELEAKNIPVVFNTSKTAAEVQLLRRQLRNRHPFIVENGSAIYIPSTYFSHEIADAEARTEYERIVLGASRHCIKLWLATQGGRFVTFAHMEAPEVAEITGMGVAEATLAQQREFSDVIQWRDSEASLNSFCHAAHQAGFRTLQGGRFLHILGACDKGLASQRLLQEYQTHYHRRPSLIACGDGENDLAMLQIADLALMVRSPSHNLPLIEKPQGTVLVSPESGPEGLARLLQEILVKP